ncbi:MAG: bifunctional methionine sulfoxide reductase B/A protein [candidate division Zixibacteria bacterium]|nr:bifunctional methionine sulfoxide reductase B/A protein [candidate division Zixibacteria bacterium]
MNYNKLTEEENNIIEHKGTERPFSGKYNLFSETGTYICKRCNSPLYISLDKFDSQCGWPSFDDEIPGAVKRIQDKDGSRTEIICNNCDAHLGHVFLGEQLTDKNTRHCVNSLSLNFIPAEMKERIKEKQSTETAYFAGGCFWGVEYLMQKETGVISTSVGYMGGHQDSPTYDNVCSGTTGHTEVAKVEFDPSLVSYEKLARLFFEIHDPTQLNRQGPDIGGQYRSEIFYTNKEQRKTIEKLIKILSDNDLKIATKLTKAEKYWNAENYHQDYYLNNGYKPYCHIYRKLFPEDQK